MALWFDHRKKRDIIQTQVNSFCRLRLINMSIQSVTGKWLKWEMGNVEIGPVLWLDSLCACRRHLMMFSVPWVSVLLSLLRHRLSSHHNLSLWREPTEKSFYRKKKGGGGVREQDRESEREWETEAKTDRETEI